jgi:hypothetical protein
MTRRQTSQSGGVFTVLLAVIAMTGALGLVTYRAPVPMEVIAPFLFIFALICTGVIGILTDWLDSRRQQKKNFAAAEKKNRRKTDPNSESGSVFTVLLAGIAIAGAMSVVLYSTMSGPMSSMVRVTNRTQAKSQMQAIANIIIMSALNQANSGSCENNGFVQPAPWRTGSYGPTGGGLVPNNLGAPLTDPWGTDYGYCVWDVGPGNTDKCGGGNYRLGTLNPSPPGASNAASDVVIAIISAGPDRKFSTTCQDYSNTGGVGTETNAVVSPNGDDIVLSYTYSEAATATSSLWSLSPNSSSTAVINKTLAVGPTGSATVTVNPVTGLINALGVTSTGAIISTAGAIGLANQTAVTSCAAGNAGNLRYNATIPAIQFCNGLGTGGPNNDGWITDGSGTTLDAITAAAANQTGIDSGAHTIVWNWSTLTAGSAMTLTAADTGADANILLTATNASTGAGKAIYGAETGSFNTGYGIYGINSGISGINYGVYGTAASSSNSAAGVYGSETGGTGANYGVYGTNNSSQSSAAGVYGSESSASTYGVEGVNSSTGPGVYGTSTTTGYGVEGVSAAGGVGVYGTNASATTGYGVEGVMSASGNTGAGVYGSNVTTGVNYGVKGVNASATAGAAGVYGINSGGGSAITYGVYGSDNSSAGYGVYGTGTYGVYGSSTTSLGAGVYGYSTSSTGFGVYCSASYECGGNQAWTNTSDRRLKERIADLPPERGLDAVLKLRPVTFHWKDKKSDKALGQRLGFIAQEVKPVFPEVVGVGPDKMMNLAYSDLIVPLVKAVQELAHEMKQLGGELNPLEAKVQEQQATIDSLKAANDNLQAEIKADNDNLRAEIEELKSQVAKGG